MINKGLGARTLIAAFAVAMTAATAGCGLDEANAPPLIGPSEFGLSVTASANPNRLPRDGSSQSVVVLTVRDAQSRPVAGQRLTLEASPLSAALSATDVVTDANGQATFTLTAPPASAIAGNTVTIQAMPVGTLSGGAVPRVIEISLTGFANTTLPDPSFTVTPPTPEAGQTVIFDASGTKDEGVSCLAACLYEWDFGDGSSGRGMVVTHVYADPRTYNVVLTVTDAAGATVASAPRPVTVKSVPPPTVTINVSPDPPFIDRQTVFTATAVTPPGHSIRQYEWDFGDGSATSSSTGSVVHSYSSLGVFVVTVRVTDDLGQVGIAARTVTVSQPVTAPAANFTFAPGSPTVGTNVTFNGSSSTVGVGASISNYSWDFGDGTTFDGGTSALATHAFGAAGTYGVTLTITDSLGRTSSKTTAVTVQ